jgi:ppGpp synthetase/RelA/SpoT-type nucleotidyltranferase
MVKQPKITINKTERKHIDKLVAHYERERDRFERYADILHGDIVESRELKKFIQFAKFRTKDPDHLRGKLVRKAIGAKEEGKQFDIDIENLFEKIRDLAGVRVLHLHTQQMEEINPLLLKLFGDQNYELIEGPIANLWDHEYEDFFKSIKIEPKVRSDTMYTSVHYIVRANNKGQATCELQVRTLSEELWGEVSHTINYPELTTSVACREQLKVLARVASSATRLVDAIFKSHLDHNKDK